MYVCICSRYPTSVTTNVYITAPSYINNQPAREQLRKSILTSLLGQLSGSPETHINDCKTGLVQDVLHNTQKASFIRLCAVFTHRDRWLEASR